MGVGVLSADSAFWGNWQFEIESVDPESEDILFSKGGFQVIRKLTARFATTRDDTFC
jgi:hypothetical protein